MRHGSKRERSEKNSSRPVVDRAVRPHLDVGRFEVAVDHAMLARRFERLGHLQRDRQRLIQGASTRTRIPALSSNP
jgi:hypothetical protein